MGPQLSDLELSEGDSDNSAVSILGVCLHGSDGDAWMSDAEGAHDDMQVDAAAGDIDPIDILWRMTEWSAGVDEVASPKVVTMVALPSDTVLTIDWQGTGLSRNDADGKRPGGG